MLVLLSLLPLFSPAIAAGPADVVNADRIVWVGVAYTQTRYIATTDFNDVEQVVHHFPNSWNGLVVDELVDDMEKGLKKPIALDVGHMAAFNAQSTTDQVIREDGGLADSHLGPDAVAAVVKSYQLDQTQGVGLTLVVDRLVKSEEAGCSWLTFFDLASRDVLYTDRVCADAGGFGFRNYWFRPVKTVLREELKPALKTMKKGG